MRKFTDSLTLAACVALACTVPAAAATFTGTVTNKTFNRPSQGDTVTLVDVQAGMTEAASTTTNASGNYSLSGPGTGPYLIRVNHQGATYFIAAPQGDKPGDITVYDVAPKVEGVAIDADMFLIEAGGGVLRIHERYLVRNTSLPPRAQYSDNTFEVILPPDAELDSAAVTRPGGLGTNTRLAPLPAKGHYTFNVPIQPNQGEKETLLEVMYHLPYSGKYTLAPHPLLPADNLVVYAANGITFSSPRGASFQQTQEDPRVQTYVAKGIHPGQDIHFTVAGEGQMAGNSGGNSAEQPPGMGDAMASAATGQPGGGLGAPIGAPDPLTDYKWWILGGLTLVLVAGTWYVLRHRMKPAGAVEGGAGSTDAEEMPGVLRVTHKAAAMNPVIHSIHSGDRNALLHQIKEELFAIESEKLAGTLSPEEYNQIKLGLEALLKRALLHERDPLRGSRSIRG